MQVGGGGRLAAGAPLEVDHEPALVVEVEGADGVGGEQQVAVVAGHVTLHSTPWRSSVLRSRRSAIRVRPFTVPRGTFISELISLCE